ncbi:hypothetical protein [Actinomadura kijaniata]|uniref:hypothetical protein n=1 Tax=Actinomadura kijaniata TaxID=46161 RepID=UPI000833DFE3|nr:hypothetical protein [Actinomadura kijaniata]
MSLKKLLPLAATALTTAGLVAAAPAASAEVETGKVTAKVGKAKYIAYTSCKAKGRWGKGYIKTDGKPTRKRPLVTVVEWGYAIQKTKGNHRNSMVRALLAVHEGGGKWRLSGGPGYTGSNAVEDNKWHKGKRVQWSSIGRGRIGENAIAFWFDFDKGTGGHCDAKFIRASQLKPIR